MTVGIVSSTVPKNGDEDALKAVGFTDKPEKHPVCSAILSSVGSGKKGKDVRSAFEDSPYGWPRDAVDAGLILLHTVGHLRAIYNGNPLAVGQLDQAKVSTTEFRVEFGHTGCRAEDQAAEAVSNRGNHLQARR